MPAVDDYTSSEKDNKNVPGKVIKRILSHHLTTKLSFISALSFAIAIPFFLNSNQDVSPVVTPLSTNPPIILSKGIQAGQPIDDSGNILITDAVATRMAASGAEWIRVNFRLGPNVSDNSQFYKTYDTIVTTLEGKGMQVVGLMSNESWPGSQANWTANNWENSRGNGENAYIDNFCYAFARMALHYQGLITYWEIWNEPNAYSTNPSPGVYQGATYIYPSNFAAMLTQCHSQVHYYNHINVQVVSGGLFGHNISGYNTASSGADYLDSTYNVGVNNTGKFAWAKATYGSFPLDQVGQHIYVDQGTILNTAGFGSYLDYVHNVITKWEGPASSKNTLITEFGWSTKYVNDALQAANMQSALTIMAGKNYLSKAIWFQLDDNSSTSFLYGIYRSDGSKKPSWTTFNSFINSGSPTPTPGNIVGETSTGTVIMPILNYYNSNGGSGANGTPFNNGGSVYAHFWDFGYVQDFNGGSVGQNSIFDTGHRVQTSFLKTYLSGSYHNLLKFPTTDAYGYGSGTRQDFQGGYMTWDVTNGVKVYTGGVTPTSVPTSTPIPSPTPTLTPTPVQISIVGKTSTNILISAILNYYNLNGGVTINGTPFNNGGSVYAHFWDFGYVQDFNGGSIGQCAIFDTGHRVQQSFLATYLTGNNHIMLKFPLNDAYNYNAGTRQDFQGGYMTWDAVNKVRVSYY